MTKSRMAVLLLMLWLPVQANAEEPVTAEQAMEHYHQAFQPVRSLDCPGGGGDEIVVCGRRTDGPDPNRLPLPVERDPGERVTGEAPSAVAAAGTREKCSTVGPNQNCGGLVPIGILMGVAVKLIEALTDPDA